MSTSVDRIARELLALRRDLRKVQTQPQLAYSSVEGGYLQWNTDDGSASIVAGQQFDGTNGVAVLNGPVPPTPTAPTATPTYFAATVNWDGLFADGAIVPMDFARVEIHAVEDPTDEAYLATTLVGTYETPRGGDMVVPLPGPRYLKLVTRTTAGVRSPASAPTALITPLSISEIDTSAIQAEIDELNNVTLPAVQAQVDTATSDISTLNTVSLPDLQTQLDDANAQIGVFGTTTIPAIQAQVDDISADLTTAQGQIDTLNSTTIPGINTTLTSQGNAINTLNNTTIPGVNASIATERGRIDTLNNTTIPGINSTLTTANNNISALQGKFPIQSVDIGALQVTTGKIANAAITVTQMGAGAVTSTILADDSVTSAKIVANTIVAADIAATTITAAQIAGGTITGTQIAALTITAGLIAADTITASQIAANAIGTSELNALAVTAAKIAANTITAAQIQALTITAAEIAANTITAGKLVADTITANEIAANAIGTSELNALAVTAAKIAANTITAAQIAATTITGDRLVANTITAAQIAANTITAAQIAAATITATQLAAGSVTATQLAAGSVTANKLLVIVGGGNLLGNSNYESSAWVDGGGNEGTTTAWSFSTADAFMGTQSLLIAPTAAATGSTGYHHDFAPIGIADGQTFTLSAYVKRTAGSGLIRLNIQYYDGSTPRVSLGAPTNIDADITAAPIGSWVRLSGSSVAPANSRWARCRAYYVSGNYVAGTDSLFIDAMQLERGDVLTAYAPKPDEILPGTIVANMISAGAIVTAAMTANTINGDRISTNTLNADRIVANSITAAKIAALTITGAQIAATTIDAGKLVANTITAGQIAALTITAAQIAANTITASQIAANTITAAQIAAGTITATQLAAGAVIAGKIAAGAIDAMTITGAILRTAATGSRMQIENDVSAGVIKFYSGAAGETAGYINPNTYGAPANIGSLTLASPNPSGQLQAIFQMSSSSIEPAFSMNGDLTLVYPGSGSSYATLYAGQLNAWGPSNQVMIYSDGDIQIAPVGATGSRLAVGTANINGKFATNYASSTGASVVLAGSTVVIGTQAYNASGGPNATNTQPFHAAAIHSWTGGVWMEDLVAGSATTATINISGRIVRTTSSRRYKNTIEPMTYDEAARALDLQAVTFRLNEEAELDNPVTYPGFIAEQAHEVGLSRWVSYDKEGRPDGFRYGELTAAHNMLIQRLRAEVDELKTEVAALKAA